MVERNVKGKYNLCDVNSVFNRRYQEKKNRCPAIVGISLCQEVQKASVYSTQLQALSGADIFKKREMLEEAGENIWK